MMDTHTEKKRVGISTQTSTVTAPVGGPLPERDRSPAVMDITAKQTRNFLGKATDSGMATNPVSTVKDDTKIRMNLNGTDRKWLTRWMKEGKSKEMAYSMLKEKKRTAMAAPSTSGTVKAQTDGLSKKRSRSEEVEHPSAKRGKCKGERLVLSEDILTKKAFDDKLKIAIIDRAHPEGKILLGNQKILKESFESWQIETLLKDPEGFIPHFEWSRFSGDIFRITCQDLQSVEFVKATVKEKGNLWQDSNLQVVGKDEVPKVNKVFLWLPEEKRQPQEVLRFIDILNRKLNLGAKSWSVLHRDQKKEGLLLTLGISNESLMALRSVSGWVYYLSRKVQISLPKLDSVAGETGKGTETEPSKKDEDLDSLLGAVNDLEMTESEVGNELASLTDEDTLTEDLNITAIFTGIDTVESPQVDDTASKGKGGGPST